MSSRPRRLRLDIRLVEQGLVESRARAQALILARRVSVNGQYVTKAGALVSSDDVLELETPEHPWVGRGGIKLAHALESFAIDPKSLVCADIGASTGGFTDVLLSRGARRVYAIDVGHGQLDTKLRTDPRVVCMERINARNLTASDLPEPVDLVTIDVSFISLRLILPPVRNILSRPGRVVALIKPQFEVGRGEVGKGGIVRDEQKRRRVVDEIAGFAASLGLTIEGTTESPISGAEGNVEILLSARLE